MGELLNEQTTNESITAYDRSYAGSYDNPYNGRPSLLFHMHRVTVRNSDDTIIATQSLPNVKEPFTPGKIYQLYNPSTGSVIPGQEFAAESAYAIIYSMMIRALDDNKAVADAIAALSAAQTAYSSAVSTYETAVALPADQATIDAANAAVSAAAAVVSSAESTLAAARAAIA